MRGQTWLEGRLAPPEREPDRAMRESVIARARSLIRLAAEADPSWRPPPFAPERYAALLGIEVIRDEKMRDWDALLMPIPKKPTILLNASVRSPARIRFSLAHELAHLFFRIPEIEPYLLRTEKKDEYYETDEARWLERMCDLGAAELILPGEEFRASATRLGFRASAVRALAEEYGASLEAVGLRMVETGEGTRSVGLFDYCSPPSAEKGPPAKKGLDAGRTDLVSGRDAYRVRRAFRSPGFPFLLPRWKSVPRSSVIHECSFGLREMEADEVFELAGSRARLHVTAFPLHRRNAIDGPPAVCATFSRSRAVEGEEPSSTPAPPGSGSPSAGGRSAGNSSGSRGRSR
jgi:Zn-dependent peptidase ImmA (M78 family)